MDGGKRDAGSVGQIRHEAEPVGGSTIVEETKAKLAAEEKSTVEVSFSGTPKGGGCALKILAKFSWPGRRRSPAEPQKRGSMEKSRSLTHITLPTLQNSTTICDDGL